MPRMTSRPGEGSSGSIPNASHTFRSFSTCLRVCSRYSSHSSLQIVVHDTLERDLVDLDPAPLVLERLQDQLV